MLALLALLIVAAQVHLATAQQPAPGAAAPGAAAAGQRGGRGATDPRVQERTYEFPDTKEQIPYAVFVSSKVSKDKKNPLIIALHGLGGDQNTMMRGNYLQLAEDGGYILVGPMGYNSSGWYGAPSSMANGTGGAAGGNAALGGGRGAAPGAPGAAPGAGAGRGAGPGGPGAGPGAAPGAGAGRGAGPGGGAGSATLGTSNETSQRSEKDVMNVLAMIKKEFNVDENRTYLMGHSMGGAGAIYIGVKYASIWAAVGAEAPATAPAGINPNNYSLEPAKNIPMIIVQGDMDTLVPVAGTRLWIDKMKDLKMTHQYVEVAGGDHGSVLTTGASDIFAFFNKYSKSK